MRFKKGTDEVQVNVEGRGGNLVVTWLVREPSGIVKLK